MNVETMSDGELETRYKLANKMVWGCTLETVDVQYDRHGRAISNTGSQRVKDTPENIKLLQERRSLMDAYESEFRRRGIPTPPLTR